MRRSQTCSIHTYSILIAFCLLAWGTVIVIQRKSRRVHQSSYILILRLTETGFCQLDMGKSRVFMIGVGQSQGEAALLLRLANGWSAGWAVLFWASYFGVVIDLVSMMVG